jgi:hypothetical protein
MKKIIASTIIASSIIAFLLARKKYITSANWCDSLEREIMEDFYIV